MQTSGASRRENPNAWPMCSAMSGCTPSPPHAAIERQPSRRIPLDRRPAIRVCVSLHPNLVLAAGPALAEDAPDTGANRRRSQNPLAARGGRQFRTHGKKKKGGSGWPNTWPATSTTTPTAIARWSSAAIQEVGVFRIGGEFYAWHNRCAHRAGPVCQGRIMKRVLEPVAGDKTMRTQEYDEAESHIVCPWHGYEFSIKTGYSPGQQPDAAAQGRAHDPGRRDLCQRLSRDRTRTISMAGSIPRRRNCCAPRASWSSKAKHRACRMKRWRKS